MLVVVMGKSYTLSTISLLHHAGIIHKDYVMFYRTGVPDRKQFVKILQPGNEVAFGKKERRITHTPLLMKS